MKGVLSLELQTSFPEMNVLALLTNNSVRCNLTGYNCQNLNANSIVKVEDNGTVNLIENPVANSCAACPTPRHFIQSKS